jgi:gas vesicle protein
MSEITLEKIDIIRVRTGVSYTDAKEALEECDGNVVDALIFIENKKKNNIKNDLYTTKDELMSWMKEVIKKGNVTRIRIKKDGKQIVDIPVNAGVAAGLIAFVWPPLIAIGVLTAVFTKITIEIVKSDGSVEIVNKIIKNTAKDVKEKVDDLTHDMKEKVEDITNDVKDKFDKKTDMPKDDNVYQYTVTFEEDDKKEEDKKEDDR